ncbi:M23 family metallopeptidase [Actinomycetota bacterium Odt1-20B]
MNDRHPSGTTPPSSAPDVDYGSYGAYDQQSTQHGGYAPYDVYATGSFTTSGGYATDTFTTATDTGSFATDPLFGDLPTGQYDTGQHDTGQYDTGQWATTTGTQTTLNYDPYAAQHHASYDTGGYDTGSYDTTGIWATAGYQQLADIPAQAGPDATGQWDASAWHEANQAAPAAPLDQTQQWETQTFAAGTFDTGAYDATAWNSDGHHEAAPHGAAHHESAHDVPHEDPYGPPASYDQPPAAEHEFTPDEAYQPDGPDGPDGPADLPGRTRPAARSRSTRRRSPAKRSALLTVAVPSVCVMGVAGIAAASVSNLGGGDDGKDTTASAPDPTSVKPAAANSKLDTQLENLSADAGDFADRASRTQKRIDLKAKKDAAEKKAAAEAARKERLRPKFALPVKQHGLSAYYGQAGVNWMSVHSGIDFPVSYGTPVMAATDGVVSTKWNSAYGNMAVVTAKDGTETWYCHLSTHKIMSGEVKAGDVIAFSGNSGNSTGPHLHFEVRPGGGSAIDPLPWLRSHDLDPT